MNYFSILINIFNEYIDLCKKMEGQMEIEKE